MARLAAVLLLVAALGCALVTVAPAASVDSPAAATTTDAAGVFRRHVAVWERGELQQLADVIDAHYVGHTSAGDRDREGLRARIEAFRLRFARIHFAIAEQIVSGDRVVSRLQATATDTTTNMPVWMIGMNISTVRSGKVVEEWAVWETVRVPMPGSGT